LLNNQIESKEKEKNKQTHQSSSSSLSEIVGGNSSKQNNSEQKLLVQFSDFQNLPQLPTIGKLYQVNSKAFLGIQYWEEHEQGKKEAERLNAKLCAIKN
jgi:hypothetical protein